MAVATSFSVKNVESAEFMTIISPASARAAMSELRAMYMQFSGMLRHPVEVPDFVPHPAIRIERQAANGNPGDEIASGGEELIHQALILGEEEDIAHEPADGIRGRQFIDPVLRTLLQKKQSRNRGGAVLTGLGQFSGERRAERMVPAVAQAGVARTYVVRAYVGNFVGKQGDVRWRQTRHRGFARARYARKQIRPAIANRAGRVQQESSALGKNQAVHNAQHRIEGIGVGVLAYAAPSTARVPAGVEVSALQEPLVAFATDPNVVVGSQFHAGDIKFKLKLGTRRTQEPVIALAQKIKEAFVRGGESNRDSSDLDHLTRPKSGQHAFPVNAQTQTTASTQSVRHQCGTCRTPAQACRAWVIFQHQEVFLEEAE